MNPISIEPVVPRAVSPIADLIAYCIPGGAEAARGVRGIKASQRGEIRSGPGARGNSFVAEEFVDATKSAFRWDARMGSGITSVHVIDAYENGHGLLRVSKGPVQLMKLVGPDIDQGELQRYLGYVGYCPAMLMNNPSLVLVPGLDRTVRLRDRGDPADAFVELEVDDSGCPTLTRAVRPMTVGKRVIATPWSATGFDAREIEGLRVWQRLEASWHPPEGPFTYIRIELTSFNVVRAGATS